MNTPENPKCFYLTQTGGCNNHQAAGNNAAESSAIMYQPWSCMLANKPKVQPLCKGYAPDIFYPVVTDTSSVHSANG